jgi:hypothetical protein
MLLAETTQFEATLAETLKLDVFCPACALPARASRTAAETVAIV